MTLNELKSIADIFSVSTDYLLGLSESKEIKNLDISRELGLSDNSINNLKKLRINKKIDLISISALPEEFPWTDSDSINLLLEDENILNMIIDYISFYIKGNNLEDITYEEELKSIYNIDLEKILREIKSKELIEELNKLQKIVKTKKEHYNKKHYK